LISVCADCDLDRLENEQFARRPDCPGSQHVRARCGAVPIKSCAE
jgi:hypothetical protein